MPTYTLYITEDGVESVVLSSHDPTEVRRVLVGRSMARRLRKAGRSLRLTRDGAAFRADRLERLCLDIWLEAQEEMRE